MTGSRSCVRGVYIRSDPSLSPTDSDVRLVRPAGDGATVVELHCARNAFWPHNMIECTYIWSGHPCLWGRTDWRPAGRRERAKQRLLGRPAAVAHCRAGQLVHAPPWHGWMDDIYATEIDPIHCRRPCREGTYTYYIYMKGSVQHQSAISTTTYSRIDGYIAALVYGRCLPWGISYHTLIVYVCINPPSFRTR
jgi:hypothetical protein